MIVVHLNITGLKVILSFSFNIFLVLSVKFIGMILEICKCIFQCTGNLNLGAVCDVCEEEAGMGCGLIDFSCCWCHRSVHSSCLASLGDVSIVYQVS